LNYETLVSVIPIRLGGEESLRKRCLNEGISRRCDAPRDDSRTSFV